MSPDLPRAPRRGHLREVRDGLPTVPELLATDSLLDRLGRHQTTEGDLDDAVARILDTYARNADPETAGVRPLQLPALAEVLAEPETPQAAPVREPRVLTARRRTLERIGRGGLAAAAVLALMGGTAAAAATGGGALHGPAGATGAVSASVSAGLPDWVPDAVFEVFGGTTEQRASNTLAQARQLASSGDPEDRAKALATATQVVEDLKSADAPLSVLASAQAAVANLGTTAGPVAAQVPGATPDTFLETIAGTNRTVAVPSPSSAWRAPLVTPTPAPTDVPTTTPTPTGSPTTAPVPAPVTTRPVTPAPSTPPSSAPSTSTPVTPAPTSGGGTSVPTSPAPADPTATPEPTGTPTEGTTTSPEEPVTPSTPVTGDPVAPTGEDGGTTPVVEPVVTTDPVVSTSPVVVPSPEAGVAPSPTQELPVVTTTSVEGGGTDAGTTAEEAAASTAEDGTAGGAGSDGRTSPTP